MKRGDGIGREDLVNGRYRVLRELGAGAMGSVHLVADTLEDDRLIALKTVRPGAPLRPDHRFFRDEFSAMAQLRHPNVVEVYDFGTISGTGDHFFTMEFVDGTSLLDACKPGDVDTLHGYARQICRALEYIHAHGFVHFDLKPDNILIDVGGVAKVMDFGLVEKGSFFEAQMLKGTVAYIAPEMIKGETVDHRLDLYSLGAVLYHVLTGRMLFTGETLADILRMHLHAPPSLDHGMPPSLDAILTRLLAKRPADRYASAAEVLHDLERNRQPEGESSDSLAFYRLGSRLVGREAQLGRLLEIFRGVATDRARGSPSTVMVMGASGMGKSRLMQELRHEVQIEGTSFIQGACIQHGGHSYQPFAEILRTLVREIVAAAPGPRAEVSSPLSTDEAAPRGEGTLASGGRLLEFARTLDLDDSFYSEVIPHPLTATRAGPTDTFAARLPNPEGATVELGETIHPGASIESPAPSSAPSRSPPLRFSGLADREARRLLEARATALSMLVPEDGELCALAEGRHDPRSPWSDGGSPAHEAPSERPAALPPGREKDWLIDSICSFFVELSRVHPLVLYCSDLQWADDLTVELFARLSRAVAEATLREGAPARLMLCGCFRDDEITGGALDKAAPQLLAEGVVESIRVGPLDPTAVAEMLHSMLGHVEIPAEALQTLVERTAGVPFSIEATLQDFLERRASSVRGSSRQIDAGELGSSLAPATVAEALDRTLEKLSVVEGAVVRLLAVFNRPAPAALLREAGSLDGDSLTSALARLRTRHLLQRGWADGSVQWSLRHARLRQHVYEALGPAERSSLHAAAGAALDRVYPGAERYLEDISQHFERAGNVDRAIHYLHAAGDQAKRVYDLKRAGALYARAYDALGTLPETPERRLLQVDLAVAVAEVSYYSPSERSRERLGQALEIVDAAADIERRARVLNWLGRTNYALGRHQEAIRCFQDFVRLSEGTADDLTRALPYRVLGNVYIFLGRFEQARDYLARGAALLRNRRGVEEELSYVLGMYGGTYIYLGDFARAEQLTLESIALAEKIGHRTRTVQGQIYLGIVYAIQGEWSRARAILERSLEIARHDQNIIGTGTGSSFLGLSCLAEGDARRAVELCRFGWDYIARAGGTWTLSMVGTHLAEALLASGEPGAALAFARETLVVVKAGERWGEACLHLTTARIHERLGDAEAARGMFALALQVAEEQRSPTFAAKVHLGTGAFLLRSGDGPEGTALIERALASFDALAMPWYAARARARLGGSLEIDPCP